ncbi:MAG: phosphodiester glycosidase family protein [Planctomycetota bacterium]|jgi:glycosyltransferase involved in cell wall biosynthesis
MAHPRTDRMISDLRAENVETWFDLGLLIDRLREDRQAHTAVEGEFAEFKRRVARGIAFMTFGYGVDGVTMEVAKYARALVAVLPGVKIHYIAGGFAELANNIIGPESGWHQIDTMDGFDRWPMYRSFFGRRLERGSPLYNKLIREFWEAVLELCERLGGVVEANQIQLLYLVNVNSNPGNPALALATVLVAEHFGLPVINNCHDFYWESGHSEIDREVLDLPRGSRDHFFTNAHVGEVFSLIEVLYPWDARSWLTVCINAQQVDKVSERFGLNPANVGEICTGIDMDRYTPMDRGQRREVWHQLCEILKGTRSRLHAVAAAEVIEKGMLAPDCRRPILIAANKQTKIDFVGNNMVLLQPTRILARKRIDFNFTLIAGLLADDGFAAAFRTDKSRKLTLLVSGPVAAGHDKFLKRLVRDFARLVQKADESIRSRIYLALLFSEFDNFSYRERYDRPIEMPELYSISTLVVLPSESEGRGLPIIESAACGVPILTRRYEPEEVFAAVIGEDLASEDRLDVKVFVGWRLEPDTIAEVRECLLAPERFAEVNRRNRSVVQKRFSLQGLARDLDGFLRRLHHQLGSGQSAMAKAGAALDRFAERISDPGPSLAELLVTGREYLPGFGRMGNMLMLKSLIDPSYFRVEEQRTRGMAYAFARRLVARRRRGARLDPLDEAEFFNSVDSLFLIRAGEMPIQIDHSLAYRHRNRRHYRYRELTPQELTAVIVLLDHEMFGPWGSSPVTEEIAHQLANWNQMVARCCGGPLEIDDRESLLSRSSENVPIALFLGDRTEHQLEVFVLQTARIRLGLGTHEDLSATPPSRLEHLAPITIIEREEALPGGVDATSLEAYLKSDANKELQLLHRAGICRVVTSRQLGVGIDFRQLGEAALQSLVEIRERKGFLIALCEQAAVTTDGVALERFHLGRADDPLTANILGISIGSGFVQRAPGGLRCTLAYPTPVQTARSLSNTLRSRRFRRLCKRMGEDAVLTALREDAEERGSPVDVVLSRLSRSKQPRRERVEHEALTGVYEDGCSWSGVIAQVAADSRLRYSILSAKAKNQTVPEFVRRFDRSHGRRPRIAWNGGYILNAELVGKLGLPESYIGSPLGLIVSQGRVLSPPLFDKPAFTVSRDRSLGIRRVSCASGLSARFGRSVVEFPAASRNPTSPGVAPCFYDLLYPGETLPGNGRTIVRLVGNRIMELRSTEPGEDVPVLPVGLVFSFPGGETPKGWTEGRKLTLELNVLSEVASAVEAGPMLLEDGEVCIDMHGEGWTTANSIRTQAARLDYLDMRGPKIAIGLDDEGTLAVLAVNGRIRESVGATHVDMAEILRARGMRTAMGFDPGGSATLVVDGQTLNISPYNRDYERNVYALEPQPRAVANAIVGY